MGAIILSLQSLIITVRRNGFSSVLTFFFLITLIVLWSARGNISSFLEHNPPPTQEKNRFDQSIVADAQINGTLDDIRKSLSADRIVIRQFHNSKTDLTGLPFASVSTTYYSLAPGVALTATSMDAFPLSTINEELAMIFHPNQTPQCAKVVASQVVDDSMRLRMDQSGTAIRYVCPIMNLSGQPIGVIGAAYLTIAKPRPDDAKIEDVLNNTGERAVGYLDGVIKRERKPWYEAIFGEAKPNGLNR